MTRVLVTGGAGFVGSHVVDRLVAEGYDVTVLDSLVEEVHDGPPEYCNDEATYVWGDVRDRDTLVELLEEADVVNHQASAVGIGRSMYEVEKFVDANSRGTAVLLDALVNEDVDVDRLVVASSMSIYGEGEYYCESCDAVRHPGVRATERLDRGQWEPRCSTCESAVTSAPTPESKPPECTSVYATTKRSQEELALTVGRSNDVPTVALRYFNIYGSRQSLDNPYTGVCAIFSSRIKNGNPPLVFEDGRQTRDFVHVSDVARANQAAIESESAVGEAINVGTGTPTSIRTVAETLLEAYGVEEELAPEITGEYRQGDVRHCYADVSRAEELLDFEATVDFETGIAELVEWGRRQDAEDNFADAYRKLSERGFVETD